MKFKPTSFHFICIILIQLMFINLFLIAFFFKQAKVKYASINTAIVAREAGDKAVSNEGSHSAEIKSGKDNLKVTIYNANNLDSSNGLKADGLKMLVYKVNVHRSIKGIDAAEAVTQTAAVQGSQVQATVASNDSSRNIDAQSNDRLEDQHTKKEENQPVNADNISNSTKVNKDAKTGNKFQLEKASGTTKLASVFDSRSNSNAIIMNDKLRELIDRTVERRKGDRELKIEDHEVSRNDFIATTYDLSYESCGKYPSHPAYGITFSGRKAVKGRTIAVDPNVIPLGSKVYIEFPDKYSNLNGWYVAEDTGNKVKGKIIDVFLGESAFWEMEKFGSRKVNVKILYPGSS